MLRKHLFNNGPHRLIPHCLVRHHNVADQMYNTQTGTEPFTLWRQSQNPTIGLHLPRNRDAVCLHLPKEVWAYEMLTNDIPFQLNPQLPPGVQRRVSRIGLPCHLAGGQKGRRLRVLREPLDDPDNSGISPRTARKDNHGPRGLREQTLPVLLHKNKTEKKEMALSHVW